MKGIVRIFPEEGRTRFVIDEPGFGLLYDAMIAYIHARGGVDIARVEWAIDWTAVTIYHSSPSRKQH